MTMHLDLTINPWSRHLVGCTEDTLPEERTLPHVVRYHATIDMERGVVRGQQFNVPIHHFINMGCPEQIRVTVSPIRGEGDARADRG